MALSIAVMRRTLFLVEEAARGRRSHQRHVINVPYKVYDACALVHAHAGRHEGLHHVHLSGADCAAPCAVLSHYLELAPSTLVTWTPVAQPHLPLMPKANLLRGATSAAVPRHHHYPRRITGAYWQASRHQRGRPSMVPPWSLAAAARKINLEQASGNDLYLREQRKVIQDIVAGTVHSKRRDGD